MTQELDRLPNRIVNTPSGPLRIQALTTMPEMKEVVRLEEEIWGYGRPGSDAPYPARALFAFSESGGLVAGAFSADRLVAFAAGWQGVERESEMRYLHSQLVGVLTTHRHLGIGFQLKLYQRDYAILTGLDLVKWTFDPLLSTNANLNLRKLGAVVRVYAPSYYGDLQSQFTGGLASDRVWVSWYVRSRRVQDRLSSHASPPSEPGLPSVTKIETVSTSAPELVSLVDYELGRSEPRLLLEIPADFGSIRTQDLSLALDWQTKIRSIYLHYFGRGYIASDFFIFPGRRTRTSYLLTCSPLDQILESEPLDPKQVDGSVLNHV